MVLVYLNKVPLMSLAPSCVPDSSHAHTQTQSSHPQIFSVATSTHPLQHRPGACLLTGAAASFGLIGKAGSCIKAGMKEKTFVTMSYAF